MKKSETERELFFYIDELKIESSKASVIGWVASVNQPSIRININGSTVNCDGSFYYRPDIKRYYPYVPDNIKCGFQYTFPYRSGDVVSVTFEDGISEKTWNLSRRDVIRSKAVNGSKFTRLPYRTMEILKKDGAKVLLSKVIKKLRTGHQETYEDWISRNEPNDEQLQEQRKTKFDYSPLISFVIPMFRTDHEFLQVLINSLESQTYQNWEACFADAGKDESGKSINTDEMERYQAKDSRIKYIIIEENKSIADNTNEAIKIASGKYIAFSDHDDIIAPDALFEVVKAINMDRSIDSIYSDQDMIDWNGNKRFNHMMKPDFNEAMLCSTNYTTHLSVFKKELLDQVGYLDSEYDGSQDYDLEFRCYEKSKRIYHIPKVLYHWRNHLNSTAGNPESKHYAFENGRKAIEAHYKRQGIPATVEMTPYYGIYRTRYHWNNNPLVSIIIPNKDHIEDLDRCVRSVLEKTDYPEYEILIIENNSEKKETFEYYSKIEKNEKIKVIRYDGKFNYSKINNFGVSRANGEYLLLLNNDTEVISRDWLSDMMGFCQRNDVGIVGAKLYYEDGSIQHAGAIIGLGGVAAHAFAGERKDDYGYMSRLLFAQDYSAVTAACMLTKREVFEKVNGLSEHLAVAYNDMDYCLKVKECGYRVIFDPYAELFHYESKSRGYEDNPEKRKRQGEEIRLFLNKWSDFIEGGDPAYNPNLTLSSGKFTLKTESEENSN